MKNILAWFGAGRTNSAPPAPIEQQPVRQLLVERRELCLAGVDPEGVRALVGEFNEKAQQISCLVLSGNGSTDVVTIIFSGNGEKFHMLPVARNISGKVVYVQDVENNWYQGSDCFPDLLDFCKTFLVGEIGNARALFFGQSSGAYAALIASTFFPGASVLACAPQTFADGPTKARINFVGIRALSTPDTLIDVKNLLLDRVDNTSLRVVVIAAGEIDNPIHFHYWMDYLHILRLVDVPGLSLFVVNSNTHVIVHGRVNQFALLLEQLSRDHATSVEARCELVSSFLASQFVKAA